MPDWEPPKRVQKYHVCVDSGKNISGRTRLQSYVSIVFLLNYYFPLFENRATLSASWYLIGISERWASPLMLKA